MKISDVIRELTQIQNDEGDMDFVTVYEVGEQFGIGTQIQIGVIEYPTDPEEKNWEKVTGVLTGVDLNNQKPKLTLLK